MATVKILEDEKGLEYTNYEMLRADGSSALTTELGRDQKCSDIFAGVLAIRTVEE